MTRGVSASTHHAPARHARARRRLATEHTGEDRTSHSIGGNPTRGATRLAALPADALAPSRPALSLRGPAGPALRLWAAAAGAAVARPAARRPGAAWGLRRVARAWRAAFAGVAWEPSDPFPVRLRSAAAARAAAEAAAAGRLPHLPALAALAAAPGGAWELAEARVECAVPAAALSSHLLATLEALRPAAPRLARLSLAAALRPAPHGHGIGPVPLLPPERLGPLLEPFAALESLQLPPRLAVPPSLAECIAACCPRLRRAALALAPADLPALSALPLECFALYAEQPRVLAESVGTFPSLRSLHLLPPPDDPAAHCPLCASGPALRSLPASFPRLARLDALLQIEEGASGEEVAALAALPRLTALRLRLAAWGPARAPTRALRSLREAGALAAIDLHCPPRRRRRRPSRLCGAPRRLRAALAALDDELAPGGASVEAALEALARAAAGARRLRPLRLAALAPTDTDEGLEAWGALADLAPLGRRLELRVTLVSPQRYERRDWHHYADGRRQSPIEEEYRSYLPALVPAAAVRFETEYSEFW
eukprot:tig00001284_g8005.t1